MPRPDVVCVENQDPRLESLEAFNTVAIVAPSNSGRYQVLRKQGAPKEKSKWLVLFHSPGKALCVPQPLENPEARYSCVDLDVDMVTKECEARLASTGNSRCTLRPTPYDNPVFPAFPDPESSTPRYFAPWPAYEDPGGMPGDLDKEFFEYLRKLAASAPENKKPGSDDPLSVLQRRQLEILAWQEFVSLNWPLADQERGLMGRHNLTDAAVPPGLCPAWAGWRRKAEVMVKDKDKALPLPWGLLPSAKGSGTACSGFLDGSKLPVVSATSGPLGKEFGDPRKAAHQTTGHLLFDARGMFVFYDTRINHHLYESILARSLYHQPVKERLHLNHGRFYVAYGPGMVKASAQREGPIAAKFAWKPLTTCDDQDRFILAQTKLEKPALSIVEQDLGGALCSDGEAESPGIAVASPLSETTLESPSGAGGLPKAARGHLRYLQNIGMVASGGGGDTVGMSESGIMEPFANTGSGECSLICDKDGCLLGLVAMHIAHKTASNQNWNWSTFIHRDAFQDQHGREPLFRKGPCGTSGSSKHNCNECKDDRCFTRICEAFEPAKGTEALNEQVGTLLVKAKTSQLQRLANYRLLGVQWIDEGGKGTSPDGLLNPLMETFVTDPTEDDCYSCHTSAEQSDFMFFLGPQPE